MSSILNWRWTARIDYRTGAGTQSRHYPLSEISDLEAFVEAGPHWDTIEKIEIVRINHVTSRSLTVEAAEAL